jgi:hypothetical protein
MPATNRTPTTVAALTCWSAPRPCAKAVKAARCTARQGVGSHADAVALSPNASAATRNDRRDSIFYRAYTRTRQR